MQRRLCAGLLTGLVLFAGCARKIGDDPSTLLTDGGPRAGDGGDAAIDGGLFGNADGRVRNKIPDAAVARDAAPDLSPDAFFINDPPPPYCGPEGETAPPPPGGTPDCPDDKNREGCPCPEQGMQAPCWPGKRIHRNHGICTDGTTTCQVDEFGLRWGACEGYVLPKEGAAAGPESCGCFSSGKWTLSNISPCILRGNSTWIYSGELTDSGELRCGDNLPEPPPAFDGAWSENSLNVDCAGQFTLCFTIKAGDVDSPENDDCVIMQHCADIWYPEAGVDQRLPDIDHWVSRDTECAAKFDAQGGYGEMSVLGTSIECDAIDDGKGEPYVFHRTNYCPPSCQNTPNTAECVRCMTGGSGEF